MPIGGAGSDHLVHFVENAIEDTEALVDSKGFSILDRVLDEVDKMI